MLQFTEGTSPVRFSHTVNDAWEQAKSILQKCVWLKYWLTYRMELWSMQFFGVLIYNPLGGALFFPLGYWDFSST